MSVEDQPNWTNDAVFASVDRRIAFRDGRVFTVNLYPSGWALLGVVAGQGPEGMDIWTIRRVLNDADARQVWSAPG